jgi:hypothetical protein
MKTRGLTVAQIVRDTDCPGSTLYSYLDGKSASMKGTTQERITAHYGVTAEALFGGGGGPKQEVGVWGKIGAGAEVYPLTDYDSVPMYEIALPSFLDPQQEFVGFEIDGFSMPPAQPGFVVIFRKVEMATEDLIGFPCLIDTSDGKRLFKMLRRGYAPGLFNLESWDGSDPIEDVKVITALPFAGMSPGRKAR